MGEEGERLRDLPSVDRVAADLDLAQPPPLRVAAARAAVDEARESILKGEGRNPEGIRRRASEILRFAGRRRLIRVVNATGVLLHTNLGRAPLAGAALESLEQVASGYSNLEYDVEEGGRGSRYLHTLDLLKMLTGAEDALVVNNNAAAVLLALSALASEREVVVSRGELIEIGGEFRLPEILSQSGSVLVEVGTTNRTHLRDYERAIGAATAAIMKVHPSNYRVIGFTKEVSAPELAALAASRGVRFIHDIGSGLLRRMVAGTEPAWLAAEPTVQEAVSEGADLVCFSTDKLLGGPQGGVVLGRSRAVGALRGHPLLRALRVGKQTISALEGTLVLYAAGREGEIPFWSMALEDPDRIATRARTVAAQVGGDLDVVPGFSTPGGGSGAGAGIPTMLLTASKKGRSAREIFLSLLQGDPPVVARIENDVVVLDLRTVPMEDDTVLVDALVASL